jgi:hypothetical protein
VGDGKDNNQINFKSIVMISIKRLSLFFVTLFVLARPVAAQPIDSASIAKLQSSVKQSDESIATLKKEIDSLKKLVIVSNTPAKEIDNPLQVVLVLIPFAFLLLLIVLFINWIKKSGFTLKDALSTAPDRQLSATIMNARVAVAKLSHSNSTKAVKREEGNITPANPNDNNNDVLNATAAIPDPKPQPSASRLLAFITGMVAIIIAVSLVSYTAYALFAGNINDKLFDGLWKILAGLGIGVIPYGINIWKGNPKEQENITQPAPSNP